jgi:hypothetical protein
VRVAEVDVDICVDTDAGVSRHLLALIPGQRAAQRFGQGLDGCDHRLGHRFGIAPGWQMQQWHEASGALDQGADLGALVFAEDQIALPVPGHRAVGGLGGPLADVDHARDPATALPGPGTVARFAQRASGTQTFGQLTAQFPASLHVERFIDGFVGHLHLRAIGISPGQHPGDLFGAVPLDQQRLHLGAQRRAATQLASFRSARPLLTAQLGDARRVARLGVPAGPAGPEAIPRAIASDASARRAVVGDLTHDR